MTHRLVETTTRTVLKNEQRHNCELNVSACPVLQPAWAARRALQKPKRSDGCSETEVSLLTRSGASCSRVAGPGVHICRNTVSGVNYDASAPGDNDSHGARRRTAT